MFESIKTLGETSSEALSELLAGFRTRAPLAAEAAAARIVAEPASVAELREVVARCERNSAALAPLGACRTLSQMRAAPVAVGVSLAAFARVIDYEPDDMTVAVGAGLTLEALSATIGARRQYLPLDPVHPELTTIGALIGAAQCGPLRLAAGTVRDYVIGIRFVGHGGKLVHGGGRVVKNVAGYDLMKVLTGSFGTLGIVTEAIFKVRPEPEAYALALGRFAGPGAAFEAALRLHDRLPLFHLDLLSPALQPAAIRAPGYLLMAGVAGNAAEVDFQTNKVVEEIPDAELIRDSSARRLYDALRDAEPPSAPITIRLAVLPRALPAILSVEGLEFRAHAGSGVADIGFAGISNERALAAVAELRQMAAANRGQVRLLTVAPALKAAVPFFDQPAEGTLKLMRTLKQAFDPGAIFNPGCFVGGI